jgi:peptidoglycan/xylan/chitin deacetylase (PgdA/CDA1 family)
VDTTRRAVTSIPLVVAAASILRSRAAARSTWTAHWPRPFPTATPRWLPGGVVTETGERAVAFTFDDGPRHGATDAILDFLQQRQLKATFSMIGEAVAANPAVAHRVVAAGMEIANHTWDHNERVGHLTSAGIEADIRRAQNVIHATTGQVPHLFRAPGGAWTPRLLDVLRHDFSDMMPLGWTVESRDWSRPGVHRIVSTVEAEVHHGSILVFHDLNGCSAETLAALPIVYDYLLARGYHFTQIVNPQR